MTNSRPDPKELVEEMKTRTIELNPSPFHKMQVFGATGRISDIITSDGYDHLLNIMEQQDEESRKAVELLHKWTGWALELIDSGYKKE